MVEPAPASRGSDDDEGYGRDIEMSLMQAEEEMLMEFPVLGQGDVGLGREWMVWVLEGAFGKGWASSTRFQGDVE